MPNEFEKQVKQKLDELRLVPDEPVWKSIEEQIGDKKDRRLAFLWPLLLLLLAAGGIWIFAPVTHNRKAVDFAVPGENRNAVTAMKPSQPFDAGTAPGTAIRNARKEEVTTRGTSGQGVSAARSAMRVAPRIRRNRMARLIEYKRKAINTAEDPAGPEALSTTRRTSPVLLEALHLDILPQVLLVEHRNVVASEAPAAAVVKVHHSTISVGFTGSLGLSGLRNGPGLSGIGSQYKMSSAAQSGGSYGSNYLAMPPTQDHIYFSIGLTAQKNLGRHWGLDVSLAYNYFSAVSSVGQRLPDTVVNSVSQPRYYGNYGVYGLSTGTTGNVTGGGNSPAGPVRDYVDRYHFISVPLTLQYQVAHLPLQVYGGLALHYLLHSTALQYNSTSNVYFYDKAAFNRWQCSALIGLRYSILQQHGFLLDMGPQLLLGSQLDGSTYPARHLIAVGLAVRYMKAKRKP